MGDKRAPGYTMKYQHRTNAKYSLWSKVIASWPAPTNKKPQQRPG
jgi:hypothetical protein